MIKRNLVVLTIGFALMACADAGNEDETAADSVATQPANAPVVADTAAAAGTSNGMLDPNAATVEQLSAIPGVTPEIANSLVNGRPYADMRAVDAKLTGLSDEQKDSVFTKLWKPIDLNTATKEEMELIPGVGPRMRHEFEEYRPWTSIEQFRREIGKYVDADEVARLERFVTIRPAAQ